MIEKGKGFSKGDTTNFIIDPGNEIEVRTYGTIDVEISDLNDSFTTTVNVPSSDKEKILSMR